MKRISVFLLSLLLPVLAWPQATSGFHRIAQLISRGSGVSAQVVPNGSIYVTVTSTGLAATIYSDPLLTLVIQNSTVSSDANGNYNYYLPLSTCVNENVSSPGQGSFAIANVCGNTGNLSTPISIPNGGTGATTATQALVNLGAQAALGFTPTNAAVVPSTVPTAGQILVGNSGGTAYAPVSMGGDCTLAASGAITCLKTNGTSFGTGATANISFYALLASPAFTGTPVVPTDGTCNANPTQAANETYVNTCGTGGGSSITYTSPTLNYIPVVNNASGPVLINSNWTDNGSVLTALEPVTIQGLFTIPYMGLPTTTAANSPSYNQNYGLAYCLTVSGSTCLTTQTDAWAFDDFICSYANCGATPTSTLNVIGPATLSSITFLIEQNTAWSSSVTSVNSPILALRGYSLNGSGVAQLDDWDIQSVFGSGDEPSSTLVFSKSRGTTGNIAVQVPQLVVTGGTPGIQLTGAAFSTYPACAAGTKYLIEAINDSTTNTWGATITGSGSDPVLGMCDGTQWTVFAK